VTGDCLQIFKGHSAAILAIALSHNDLYMITSSRDHAVKIWDIQTGNCLQTIEKLPSIVCNVKFIPSQPHIAIGCGGKNIYHWNTQNDELNLEIIEHDSNILTIDVSHDGRFLATGGEDTQVNIWDLQTKELIKTLVGHGDTIYNVTFSADGNLVASSSRDETVKLWDIKAGQCIKTYRDPRPYEGLNIQEVTGLTPAQKTKLISLGAIEEIEWQK
jgi:WD40 repeat protein